jgi:hypothetical protein
MGQIIHIDHQVGRIGRIGVINLHDYTRFLANFRDNVFFSA